MGELTLFIPHSAPPAQHTDSKDIFHFNMTIEKHNNLLKSVGYKGKARKVGFIPRLRKNWVVTDSDKAWDFMLTFFIARLRQDLELHIKRLIKHKL